MIDKAIFQHLSSSAQLADLLAKFDGAPAVFYQEAPTDTDPDWPGNPQYPRIIFALDVQGDPARAIGGRLMAEAHCAPGTIPPEELEPVVRKLVDGYFFSDTGVTMAAQWEDSRYFTDTADSVSGVTLTFSLLAFPMISTEDIDVTARANEWTAKRFPGLLVINRDALPAWKPSKEKCAVYWRVDSVKPAGWIPDAHQTVWRSALLKCHIFATDVSKAASVAQNILLSLDSDRRFLKPPESPIIVNRDNSVDMSVDALRVGQVSVEATFGFIIKPKPAMYLEHINYV